MKEGGGRGRDGTGPRNSTIAWRLWENDFGQERPVHLKRVRRDEKAAALEQHSVKKHPRSSGKPHHRQHRTASRNKPGGGAGGRLKGALGIYIPNSIYFV